MSNGALLLVGGMTLGVITAAVAVASRIWAEAGLRVFFWPRLAHGYEVIYTVRVATTPWWLLCALLATNGLAIMLFGHDLAGARSDAYGWWLAATLVPIFMAHLVDFRRSTLAAAVSLLAVAGAIGGAVWLSHSWVPAAVGAPFLLWTLNGLRATLAHRSSI